MLPMSFQEAVRNIRTRILLSPSSAGARTIAVTSSRPGEGKTTISSSLAVALAMGGRRVLLIDGDLRRAQIGQLFNVARAPGLSNVIRGDVKPSQAFVETDVKGLFVMPAGDEVPNPGDLLEGERLNQLIRGLNRVFDLVIIDCAPVMGVADASIIANAASAVVFVVGSGTTSREVAQAALERIHAVRGRVIGVVLNKTKSNPSSPYFEPYYSAQGRTSRA
jgi:capsular exopolysaccharide synthesis family protein